MTTGISFQNGSYTSGTASASAFTTSGGISVNSLYNTEYLDSKYNYADTKEGYEMSYAGRDAVLDTQISNIITYLQNGQEDKAMAAYEKLINEMSTQTRYESIAESEGQLQAVARQLIEAELGSDLEEYIRENARDAAGVEAQKIRTLGNCDSTSQEDLLLAMCDIEEEKGSNFLLDAVSVVAMPFELLGNLIFNGGKKVK